MVREQSKEFIDQLRQQKLIALTEVREFFVLELTESGRKALAGDAAIIVNPISPPRQKTKTQSKTGSDSPLDGPLFESLRLWRKEEAVRQGYAPFYIFHDSMLRAMVSALPKTVAELALVSGVGIRKAELHGKAVLRILNGGLDTSD